jgi:hypothetical protein
MIPVPVFAVLKDLSQSAMMLEALRELFWGQQDVSDSGKKGWEAGGRTQRTAEGEERLATERGGGVRRGLSASAEKKERTGEDGDEL